jgi:lysocardiolipin and lysophospholipid acyltransferase
MQDPERRGLLFTPLVGCFYLLFLWLINILGAIFMLGPVLPLLFVVPDAFRHYEDFCFATGISFSCFVMEVVWGIKFIVTGDPFKEERTLAMMNHRTNFDWLFYWDIMGLYGSPRHLKILLKNELRKVFGFNWIAQLTLYAFLRRKFEDDRPTLFRTLTTYTKIPDYKYHCLIFPEGTVLSPNGIQSSNKWAVKFGLPSYRHVLHPRTTGLLFCLSTLRQHKGIDAVYDLTLGYLEGPMVSKLGLFKGQPPHEVHVHVRRYPIASVPEDNADIERWCQDLWSQKEQRLADFHRDRRFPGDMVPPNPQYPLRRNLATLYWLVYVPAAMYGVYQFPLVRAFFIAMCVIYTALTHTVGLETVELFARGIPFPPKEKL